MSDEQNADTAAGADLIAAERKRQVEDEGYTPDHDAEHDEDCALAWAARCYIDAATIPLDQWEFIKVPPLNWPWERDAWRPSRGADRVRDLVKAGALIAAEIDRLQTALAPTRLHGPDPRCGPGPSSSGATHTGEIAPSPEPTSQRPASPTQADPTPSNEGAA